MDMSDVEGESAKPDSGTSDWVYGDAIYSDREAYRRTKLWRKRGKIID